MKKYLAIAVAGVVGIVVALTWARLGADFWPPDRSFVGPNLVASVITWAIVLIAGALIYPPTRRLIERAWDRKLAVVHDHLKAIRAHAEHQTRVIEDHYEATVGKPHPHAGRLDNLTKERP